MPFKFKGCAKCKGDLLLDGDEWRCWQCGTYYYPNEPVMDAPLQAVGTELAAQSNEDEAIPRRVRTRTMTHINLAIMANQRSEDRWLTKNQDIINRLKRGDKVRKISELLGKGERQVRAVQERLKEMSLAI